MPARNCIVRYVDVILHEAGHKNNLLDLSSACDILVNKSNFLHETIRNIDDRWELAISDMAVDKQRKLITILFLAADKQQAPSALIDLQTYELEKIIKKPNQAVIRSAHLVINYNKKSDAGYPAILEECVGISRSVIAPFLTEIINKFVVYLKNETNGQKKKISAKLRVAAVNDTPISKQMNDAQLLSVEFFKRPKDTGIDQATDFIISSETLVCKPKKKTSGFSALENLKLLFESDEAKKWPGFRIHISREEGGKEKQKTVSGYNEDHPLEQALQKTYVITGLKEIDSDATNEIIPDLREKMEELLTI